MNILLPALAALAMSGVAGRLWYMRWRRRRVESNRRVEAPNSYYSSEGVRNQEDRERWGEISGVGRTHFCGAYWGNGFHEAGVKSGLAVAASLGMTL